MDGLNGADKLSFNNVLKSEYDTKKKKKGLTLISAVHLK